MSRYIDADALKIDLMNLSEETGMSIIGIFDLINNAPTVEERPKGKWIKRHIITDKRSFDMCVCSNCRTEFSWDAETGVSMDNYDTCPNCNADMKGEEE